MWLKIRICGFSSFTSTALKSRRHPLKAPRHEAKRPVFRSSPNGKSREPGEAIVRRVIGSSLLGCAVENIGGVRLKPAKNPAGIQKTKGN